MDETFANLGKKSSSFVIPYSFAFLLLLCLLVAIHVQRKLTRVAFHVAFRVIIKTAANNNEIVMNW